MSLKVCKKCSETKSVEDFDFQVNNVRYSKCRTCRALDARNHRAAIKAEPRMTVDDIINFRDEMRRKFRSEKNPN